MTRGTPEDAKRKAASTYNATSDYYDSAANTFWERFGRQTVDRLKLAPGMRVLDVCCGSGASAIPAAEAVGPQGSVLGVDLAENLLDLARAKAKERGLKNVEFRSGDMLALDLPDGSFDAVICVFGIFFVPDMASAARELWRLVAPGGTLAITTWGPRWFEPMSSVFWNAVRDERPDLYRGFNPWDRISFPDEVRALLVEAGISDSEVVPEPGTHPLRSTDDWWAAVLGSGLRSTIDALDPATRERVRQQTFAFMRETGLTAVEVNVVFAVAAKDRQNTKAGRHQSS
jgi:ubiquinone/menaquinone biosynthesis C-methylase UbiE